MKVVFEITGEFEDNDGIADNIGKLKEVVDELRCSGSANGKYKIVVSKDEWIKIEP